MFVHRGSPRRILAVGRGIEDAAAFEHTTFVN